MADAKVKNIVKIKDVFIFYLLLVYGLSDSVYLTCCSLKGQVLNKLSAVILLVDLFYGVAYGIQPTPFPIARK